MNERLILADNLYGIKNKDWLKNTQEILHDLNSNKTTPILLSEKNISVKLIN